MWFKRLSLWKESSTELITSILFIFDGTFFVSILSYVVKMLQLGKCILLLSTVEMLSTKEITAYTSIMALAFTFKHLNQDLTLSVKA